ncbi:unnamed protein product [Pleuronectes platessa]|uniref:Uncharacterized protein n=1 Tax=Pleuronectes platessa TaxID=8262 RepID=A0A9N7VNC9_PLEPL|nr:unnamed protein product [Pleuronectes platessa]
MGCRSEGLGDVMSLMDTPTVVTRTVLPSGCSSSPWLMSRLRAGRTPPVPCDRPTVRERRAGIIRTPCCSAHICRPATANQRAAARRRDESACSVIFSGDPGEGPFGFDILDPCMEEYPPLFIPPHTPHLHTNNPGDYDRKMTWGRPLPVEQLSCAASELKLSVSILISYLDILALSRDKL